MYFCICVLLYYCICVFVYLCICVFVHVCTSVFLYLCLEEIVPQLVLQLLVDGLVGELVALHELDQVLLLHHHKVKRFVKIRAGPGTGRCQSPSVRPSGV